MDNDWRARLKVDEATLENNNKEINAWVGELLLKLSITNDEGKRQEYLKELSDYSIKYKYALDSQTLDDISRKLISEKEKEIKCKTREASSLDSKSYWNELRQSGTSIEDILEKTASFDDEKKGIYNITIFNGKAVISINDEVDHTKHGNFVEALRKIIEEDKTKDTLTNNSGEAK